MDEINRARLYKPAKRKQDKTHLELEKEKEDEFRLTQWNAQYLLDCKSTFRMEGIDTFTGVRISREFDLLRDQIRKLIDQMKVEKRYKRKRKGKDDPRGGTSESAPTEGAGESYMI